METLGKYRLLAELGRGGFATVYRAEDTTLGREVALKVLDPLLMRDGAWVAHFRKEARTVAALDHPRIVTIHEIAEAGGRLFLAMKLIAGPSLDKVLEERGALPWEEALRIVRGIAEALDYAHGKGILHRDLKPGNVLLAPQTGAVLTDFGFARLVGESSLSLSMSGGLVGTPHYLAPELWHNKAATPASDLYALGCILYEMVLGRKAFPGDTPPAVMTAHLLQPLGLPERWPPDVPPKIAEVLRAALAREPEARLGSAADFLAALEALEVDPLAEPYAALEAAIAGERWDEALRLAEDLRAQNPTYRETAALAQRAQGGLEQAQRGQLARQWQEQAEVALKRGQPAVARAAAEQWLQLLPGDARAQMVAAQAESALAAEAQRQRDAEAEKRRIAQQGAIPKPAVADAVQRQQWEAEQTATAALEHARARERLQVEEPAPVYAPVAQPAPQSIPERKAFPTWAWVLLGIVGLVSLVGLIWGLSQGGGGATPTPERIVKTVIVTQEVVVERVITATPSPEPEAVRTAEPTIEPTTISGTHALGDTWTRPADGMVMIYVPAGEFQMGSTTSDDEEPVHTVALDGFWLDRTEVTNAQYGKCVTADKCDPSYYSGDSRFNGDDQPVVGVSWHDAVAYCEWAGGRLPTEAEWEYAARGPEALTYPWGNTFDGTRLNFCDKNCTYDWAEKSVNDSYEFTAPVGSYPDGASWTGALDLAGNVWEWVADWYGSYPSGRQVNPTGPQSGEYRVLRGGSWYSYEYLTRGAYRDWYAPADTRNDIFGFRCGVSAAPGQ
jgi:formylglycine-generating enzyme required for sulfatase activity